MMPDFEMIVHELGEDDITIIPVADVHLSRKDADDNPSYDIMAKLDLEHLWRENIAFVKVQLGKMLLPSTHMKQELILSAHNKEMEVRVK